jgi:hypothetical protein
MPEIWRGEVLHVLLDWRMSVEEYKFAVSLMGEVRCALSYR